MSDLDIIIFFIAGVAIILISLYVVMSMTHDINETIHKCKEIEDWAKTNWKGEPMGRPLDEDIIIKILERWQKAFKENSHYVSASDLSLVIKDVRELPTIQSVATDTNVGDTISRQEAIDALDCINGVEAVLRSLPTIQPEPHEGHWIPHESPDGGVQYECSRCGVLWEFNDGTPEDNEAYFCPKCGAKMKGEANE